MTRRLSVNLRNAAHALFSRGSSDAMFTRDGIY